MRNLGVKIKNEALEQLQSFVKAVQSLEQDLKQASSLQELVADAEDLLIRAKYHAEEERSMSVIYLVNNPHSVEIVSLNNQLLAYADLHNEDQVSIVRRMHDDLLRSGLFSSAVDEDSVTQDLLTEGSHNLSGHQLELKES